MLSLSRENWERICDHAVRDYPSECCGIITRSRDGSSAVHPCTNLQDRLHEKDPDTYPRTSREAYELGPELIRVQMDGERLGWTLAGFYHSHVDCDAYFSEKDRADAMAGTAPRYGEAVYLVLSVRAREVKGQRAFAWKEGTGAFEEVAVVIG